MEICVLNTQSGGRIDYFGEDRHFPYRVFLLYDNLHYDPGEFIRVRIILSLTNFVHFVLVCLVTYDVVEQKEFFQTKFHRSNDAILSLAKDLVQTELSNQSQNSKE